MPFTLPYDKSELPVLTPAQRRERRHYRIFMTVVALILALNLFSLVLSIRAL